MESDHTALGLWEVLCHYASTEPDAWLIDDISLKVRPVREVLKSVVLPERLMPDLTLRDKRSGFWQNEQGDIVYQEYELGRSILIYRRISRPVAWLLRFFQGEWS